MIEFGWDVTGHEITRRALIAEAGMPEDRVSEVAAARLLYSGLDAEQTRIYRMLVDEGVLPVCEPYVKVRIDPIGRLPTTPLPEQLLTQVALIEEKLNLLIEAHNHDV